MDFHLNNFEVDPFFPIQKPRLTHFGAAAISRGCLLANIIKMLSSERYYLVVIQLPQVQFRDGEVELIINDDGTVTIEGELIRIAMNTVKRKRVKLHSTDNWGMFFRLPGPIDWRTTSVVSTSETAVEIFVRKRRHVAAVVMGGPSPNDSPPLSPDPISFAPPVDDGLNNGSI